MMRPKYVYKIVDGEFIAHSNDEHSITLQQKPFIAPDRNPDQHIYLNRENAEMLCAVLKEWLSNTPKETHHD